jgi:hypothetical protein
MIRRMILFLAVFCTVSCTSFPPGKVGLERIALKKDDLPPRFVQEIEDRGTELIEFMEGWPDANEGLVDAYLVMFERDSEQGHTDSIVNRLYAFGNDDQAVRSFELALLQPFWKEMYLDSGVEAHQLHGPVQTGVRFRRGAIVCEILVYSADQKTRDQAVELARKVLRRLERAAPATPDQMEAASPGRGEASGGTGPALQPPTSAGTGLVDESLASDASPLQGTNPMHGRGEASGGTDPTLQPPASAGTGLIGESLAPDASPLQGTNDHDQT